MTRVIASTVNIFFSLILGAVTFAYCAVAYPDAMNRLIDFASGLRYYLTTTGLDVQYNIWIKFLISEQQLVFMFFVITMRILFGLLIWPLRSLFR